MNVGGGEVSTDWEVSTRFLSGQYLETVHLDWELSTIYGHFPIHFTKIHRLRRKWSINLDWEVFTFWVFTSKKVDTIGNCPDTSPPPTRFKTDFT